MKKLQTRTVERTVPATLAGGTEISAGTVIKCSKEKYRNGEFHVILEDGREIPSVFLAYED